MVAHHLPMISEMVLRPRPSRPAVALVLVVVAHFAYVASGLPGGRAVSDVLFILAPVFGTWACGRAARRRTGRARLCWTLFAATEICWIIANGTWAWYELVLRTIVPTPSPADWFYLGALVFAVAATLVGLLPVLSSRSGTMRLVLDVLLVAGGLLLIAWATVLGPMLEAHRAELMETVAWLYPPLELTAAALAFLTMTRLSARARLPLLLVGGAFLTGATVDTVWAYANVTGGFTAGGLIDPMWVVTYAMVGLAALYSTGREGPLRVRVVPSRWEALGVYAPVCVAVLTASVQGVRGDLPHGMLFAGFLLVGVLVLRQVLAILENHTLARGLESSVAERTAELRASEEHFRSIVQNISDLIIILDADWNILYYTPSAERLGYTTTELVGRPCTNYVHRDDGPGAVAAWAEARETPGGSATCVVRIRRADGGWSHMETTVTDFLDRPEVGGMVLALRDVDERVELERRLRHDAEYDGLTGLANRARLQRELDALLSAGGRPSLLLLDLDEFKAVNDTAGHDLGDEVLVAVAARLLESTRPGDFVSRLGGDEFAVVIHDDPDGEAGLPVAERVLHALRRPLVVRGRQVRCLGSIGVATAELSYRSADLLRDADVAMYVAKAHGKGRVERFTAAMRDAVVQRQRVEELVRRAIADERLVLHYQPVVDLVAGGFVGAEALVRLLDDDGTMISPLDFIPIAEETGLIVEIGAWVLREACHRAAGWQMLRPDGPPFDIAVNVSTRQLQDGGLVDAVAGALEAADLVPGLLTLEITEGAIAAGDADVDATLKALRRLGVRLSIDDFGTGYSSLGRLGQLPVDELKIDRSFVAELGSGAEAPLVDAILAMAIRLGLSVVAEGIETSEQAQELQVGTCDRGQGFLFAKPLPADSVEEILLGQPVGLSSLVRGRARVRIQ